jgi:hypothetical protein
MSSELEPRANSRRASRVSTIRSTIQCLQQSRVLNVLKRYCGCVDLTCRYLLLQTQTFCPLASLLISRHLWLMSKPDVSPEVVEEATSSVTVLLEGMRERIGDLKMIWRRHRMDVDTQIRYYANGLLEDYYRVRCFPICQVRCWKLLIYLSEIPQGGVRHRLGEFRRTERMGF